MAAPAAILSILVNANTGPAVRGLVQVNSQLHATEKNSQRAAKAIGKVALAATAIGGAAVVGGLAYATKKAADFEEQMSRLGAVANASDKQMERFRKQALRAGAATKFSALEAAAAQTELAKGGLSVAQIMKGGLRSALALAAAGEMDLAEAAEATVNAIKLFNLRGKDAMKVADAFATAANRTTADVSDFALALRQGGSAAKSAGLTFIETTSVLEALAEAGIRGSDAGTSMKAMLAQLAAPTEKQQKMMAKLNLDFFDAEGKMKGVTEIAGMLQNKLKGLTEEQRLQAVKTIAGTDGMRALLALYDAGPQKMGRFQRELEKEGTAADTAKKKQDNLKGSLETLKGSIETLGIQVGTGLIPIFRKGADELQAFADDVGKIVERKDLSIGEKLQRSLDLAKVRAQPWVDKLSAALEEANIPEKMGRAFSAAIPVIAEAFAKGAPLVVGAFVKGFLASDIWGRLAISGWLLMRMGGPPAFLKAGTTAGMAMGTGMGAGMAAGAATGVAKGGLKGKMAGLFKSWGPSLALALLATFGPELAKKLDQTQKKLKPATPKGETELLKDRVAALGSMEDQLKAVNERQADFNRLADDAGSKEQARHLRGLANALEAVAEPTKRAQRLIQNMATGSSSSMKSLREKVKLSTRRIKDALGEDTKAGKEALTKNFRAAIANIRTSMHHGTISTRAGTREIERLMVKALQTMGFSKKQALTLREGRDPYTGKAVGGTQNLTGKQRGSYISEGKTTGDSVPALLEKGEYVLNRKAVKKVGRQALDRLNYAQAPRFQKGGIVELLHPFNDPKGHDDHLHIAMSTVAGIVALGKRLQRMGWLVGENPAFGGIQGGHSPTGYHPKGLAIDVNWPDPAQEVAKIRALLPSLGGIGGGAGLVEPPKIPRALVAGPESALKVIVQGALDTTRGAAQSVINRMGASLEGAESGVFSADGNVEQVFAQVAKRLSSSRVATQALGMAGYAESGMRDLAGGHSTSSGALQLLASTAQGMGVNPHDEGAIASLFFTRGFYGRGGANKLAREGLPAHLVAQNVQGSAFSDGSNYLAQAGPARAWMDRFGLLLGGPVGMRLGGEPMALAARATPLRGTGRQPRKGARRPKGLGDLIKKYTAGKSAKIRKNTMKKILEQAGDIGLPVKMRQALQRHSKNAADYGEFADRAASLTDETSITEALQAEMERRQALNLSFPDVDQQAMVDSMVGKVGGSTQLDWLKKQLDALFHWRNKMIDAKEKIEELREKVHKAIEVARKRLKEIQETLKHGNKRKKELEDRLEKLQKHPKKNKEAIKATKDELRALKTPIGVRQGIAENLKNKILPALTGRRDMLNTRHDELVTGISEVQGRGAGMRRWPTLPAISETGGTIFDTRLKIAELTDKPIRVTAEAATDTAPERPGAEELRELLRQANLRTAISQAQYRVFKDMPTFATGGIVPGSANAPRVIEAHAGEGVFTRDQMAAMGSGNVVVVIQDGAVDASKIKTLAGVEAERVMRTSSRRASRGLPSAGGGLRG